MVDELRMLICHCQMQKRSSVLKLFASLQFLERNALSRTEQLESVFKEFEERDEFFGSVLSKEVKEDSLVEIDGEVMHGLSYRELVLLHLWYWSCLAVASNVFDPFKAHLFNLG